jgi:hypothetical protein
MLAGQFALTQYHVTPEPKEKENKVNHGIYQVIAAINEA